MDPIQYKGYGRTRRGDADREREQALISDIATWASQILDSKRSVNDAQQVTSPRHVQNSPITTQSPTFLQPPVPRPVQPPAQLPGSPDSSKNYVLVNINGEWIPEEILPC